MAIMTKIFDESATVKEYGVLVPDPDNDDEMKICRGQIAYLMQTEGPAAAQTFANLTGVERPDLGVFLEY